MPHSAKTWNFSLSLQLRELRGGKQPQDFENNENGLRLRSLVCKVFALHIQFYIFRKYIYEVTLWL